MDQDLNGLGDPKTDSDQQTDQSPVEDSSSSTMETASGTPRGAKCDEPGDCWERKEREMVAELEQLRPLKKENQRLKRCVKGVKVLSRAFQETRRELANLRRSIDSGTGQETSRGKHSTDAGDNAADAASFDLDTSYNVPCIMVPPTNAVSPRKDGPSATSGEHNAQGQELHQSKMQDKKQCEEAYHEQDRAGEAERGVETTDYKQRSDNGNRTGWSSQHKVQRKVVKVDKQGTIPQERETDQAGGKGVAEWSTASASGAQVKMTKDADGETADLAEIEAVIKELSATDTSSPANQTTPPEITAVDVRSVATITDEGNSFARQKLTRQEQLSLQMEIHELRKVNKDWERFCKKKTSEFQSQLEEKDKQISKADLEANRRADHYDQMLLAAKARINKAEEENKKLQSELQEERTRNAKSDQLNRNLTKNNQSKSDEIIRLKEALDRKHQQVASTRMSSSPLVAVPVDPLQQRSPDAAKRNVTPAEPEPRHVARIRPKSSVSVAEVATCAPLPLVAPADEPEPAVSQSKHGARKSGGGMTTRQARRGQADLPGLLEGGSASVQETTTEMEPIKGMLDKNYGRDELKEQLELLRQQNQMFESDFKKEHADKKKALDELQTVQRELDKNKGRLQGYGHRDQPREQGVKRQEVVTSSKVKGSKQQFYKHPGGDRVAKPRPSQRKSELKPVSRDGKEVTVVQWAGNTTCKLVNPNTVIIQAEPEGQRLNINLLAGPVGADSEAKTKGSKGKGKVEPFQCPRCQRLFKGSDWESFEYHVTLCNI